MEVLMPKKYLSANIAFEQSDYNYRDALKHPKGKRQGRYSASPIKDLCKKQYTNKGQSMWTWKSKTNHVEMITHKQTCAIICKL